MQKYLKLTKFGIALFVMLSGLAGYASGFPMGNHLDPLEPILLLIGLYLVSSGSFAINQAQEWRLDQLMPRTSARPVASGHMSAWQAYLLGAILALSGLFLLALVSPVASGLALSTIVLYNGLYTLYWKRKWAFGAVPGAIPGAMPVVIGYSVHGGNLFSADCLYLFLIMFLWQMPHFWALAVRYKSDYAQGGFPVLPTQIGRERTLYHIGLYTFTYVGVALAAPLVFPSHMLYMFLVVPLAGKVLFEFFKYYRATEQKAWLPFFLWVNLSMLVFISAPIFDKWMFFLIQMN